MIQIYVNSVIQKRIQNIFYYIVEDTVKLEAKLNKKNSWNQLSLKILFDTKLRQDFLFEFLKETSIATRKWLLQQIE
jgi:hypothetical protein